MAAIGLLLFRLVLGIAGGPPPPDAGHAEHAAHHTAHHTAPADPRSEGNTHDGHGVCHLCRSADVAIPLPASSAVVLPRIMAVVVWPGHRDPGPRRPVFRTTVQPRAPPGDLLA